MNYKSIASQLTAKNFDFKKSSQVLFKLRQRITLRQIGQIGQISHSKVLLVKHRPPETGG